MDESPAAPWADASTEPIEERAMGDKSPAKTDKKKAAKTLMEKRGDKKAKKADKKFL